MKKLFILLFSFLVISASAEAASEGGEFKPGDMITHHIADDYSWHFAGNATLYLPVILIDNGNVEVFSSGNFYNENHELVSYNGYVLDHGHIYKADANGQTLVDQSGLYDLSITKTVVSLL